MAGQDKACSRPGQSGQQAKMQHATGYMIGVCTAPAVAVLQLQQQVQLSLLLFLEGALEPACLL